MNKISTTALILVLASPLTACDRVRSEPEPPVNRPAASQSQPAPSPAASEVPPVSKVEVAGLGSCQPSADVNATVTRLVDLADANGDGKVSRDEARSAMNFIVGGAFFRADANGDGKITPDEAREVRNELTNRYPALGAILAQAKQAMGESPFRSLARVLDVQYGQTLSLEDARSAVRSATDELFKAVDRNHDGSITRDEAVSAGWDEAETLARDAFAAADSNKDGYISTGEFENLVERSSKPLFDAADANKDGKLSEREAAVAMNTVVERLGVEPPESVPSPSSASQQVHPTK
ncbi:MAG TPA: EF-hand domain-containing protein [Polyangiaceae bacterium]|nr:EF-hand domain-containing protein [Polyangiaceae bacterium]